MITITDTNVNVILQRAVRTLFLDGVLRGSRNGPVLEFPEPVATVYTHPTERVLLCPVRNANPFFHFFEALWILAGRRDVRTLAYFNSRMREYSDDGEFFHAPYGWRLRHHFGLDQIEMAIAELKDDPNSRRAVLQIWDARVDLYKTSHDIPCNDTVFFKIRNGQLHMTVCNRSNDLIWGAYGANVVQFSVIQEYVAARLGVEVGPYTQMSDSLHVYVNNPQWEMLLANRSNPVEDPYHGPWRTFGVGRLFRPATALNFNFAVTEFMAGVEIALDNPLYEPKPHDDMLAETALPLFTAWRFHKARQYEKAIQCASRCASIDWRAASVSWLTRMKEKYECLTR